MDRLLARLRRALADVAPPPSPGPVAPSAAAPQGDLADAFRAALEAAAGRVVSVAGDEEAEAWLVSAAAGRRAVRQGEGAREADLRAADFGVDHADLLVAETGTVVRSYASRAEARLSLLPPTTVFVARPSQLVPDLPTALARIAPLHRSGRAYTLLLTGPSRTADIEKELVIPAHGPRALVVLLVDAPSQATPARETGA